MKKNIVAAALAAVLALSLTSCGLPFSSERVTLTVMGKKSDLEKSYMNSIFRQYEKATGNRLEVIAYEDAEFETAAEERFASGNAPDIFLHFHNADLNRFHVAEHFCYLDEEAWVSDLTEGADAYCRDDEGHLLGLPFWESSVSGCYYNKTILDSLGLKPASTQKEFDVLCQALLEAGYTPICWPADGCSWMIQLALDPVFADDPQRLEQINRNEIGYADIPEVEAMARWVEDAARSGWFGDRYLETGWAQIAPTLGSGDAVMTFIWDTWFYTDFGKGGQYSIDDFALMPIFMNTAEGGTYEGGNLNMMMVNKNGSHVEEALDFLDFCAAPENYNQAFDGISTVSCFRGQTSNIQSRMVTDAGASIAAHERVSTASRIVGYSADEAAAVFGEMLRGEIDAAECVRKMDERRIAEARIQGAVGF